MLPGRLTIWILNHSGLLRAITVNPGEGQNAFIQRFSYAVMRGFQMGFICLAVSCFALLFLPVSPRAAPGGKVVTETVEIIPDYNNGELTIMGIDLSDGVAPPNVELGGFILNVTSFDSISVVADANLNAFLPGDYLRVLNPNSKQGTTVQALLSLGNPLAGKSCDSGANCGNGAIENHAPLEGFAQDGSLICTFHEECDDGNTAGDRRGRQPQ